MPTRNDEMISFLSDVWISVSLSSMGGLINFYAKSPKARGSTILLNCLSLLASWKILQKVKILQFLWKNSLKKPSCVVRLLFFVSWKNYQLFRYSSCFSSSCFLYLDRIEIVMCHYIFRSVFQSDSYFNPLHRYQRSLSFGIDRSWYILSGSILMSPCKNLSEISQSFYLQNWKKNESTFLNCVVQSSLVMSFLSSRKVFFHHQIVK